MNKDSKINTQTSFSSGDLQDYHPEYLKPLEINHDYCEFYPIRESPNKNCVKVLIFNHEDFSKHNEYDRIGTKADVDTLEKTFCYLKYDYKVFNELTEEQIFGEIRKLNTEDYDAYMIIVLTHGYYNKILSYDNKYEETALLQCFNNLNNLKGKPKILIFQMCRYINEEDHQSLLPLPEKDMIVVHSTYPKKPAFRDTKNGTPFIQCLGKRFCLIKQKNCILDEMTYVLQDVANLTNGSQMPMISNTLTKKLLIGSDDI